MFQQENAQEIAAEEGKPFELTKERVAGGSLPQKRGDAVMVGASGKCCGCGLVRGNAPVPARRRGLQQAVLRQPRSRGHGRV